MGLLFGAEMYDNGKEFTLKNICCSQGVRILAVARIDTLNNYFAGSSCDISFSSLSELMHSHINYSCAESSVKDKPRTDR